MRVTSIAAAALLACSWAPLQALALPDRVELREMALTTWGTADGLPHNQVQDIAQTADGYLWLATWEGLVRFDGQEFAVIQPFENPGVRALAVSQAGTLWVGSSRDGIASYRDGEWTIRSSSDGLAGDQVLDLLVTANGDVWVATEADGVSVFTGDRFINYNTATGLKNNTPLVLAEVTPNQVWVGSRDGIAIISDGQVSHLDQRHGLPNQPIRTLLASERGMAYVGSEGGLFEWNGRRFNADPAWTSWGSRPAVAVLAQDAAGTLWAGSFAQGLFRRDGLPENQLNTANGLPNNRIWSIFEDAEDNIWIGTSGGLARLTAAPFWTLDRRNGLGDNYVRAILETPDEVLWVATSSGLNRVKGYGIDQFGAAQGLNSDSIQSLAWFDNALWVGTYGAGLNVIRDGQVTYSLPDYDLPSGHVRSLLADRDAQTLWIATAAGLVSWRDGTALRVDRPDDLPSTFVQSLYQDTDGALWLGTLSGAAVLRDGKFARVDGPNGDVFGFAEDRAGRIWMASESGLWLRDAASNTTRITVENGLPHNVIFSVLVDGDDLWMTSNAGVFQAPLEKLVAAAAGPSQVAVRHYLERHGLATRQGNGGTQPNAIRREDGSLAFATAGGVALTIPNYLQSLASARYQANVVLQEVTVDGQPLRGDQVSDQARYLDVRFTGLHLRAPENLSYRYRLQGYDDDWTVTRGRTARYTGLPARDYQLDVQARVGEGDWSPSQSRSFTIKPRWHQTAAGRLVLGLGILLTGLLIYQWRVAALRRQADRLAQEVKVRTRHLDEQTGRLLQANKEKTALLSKLEEQSRDFEHQARHDALTGLPNRRQFDEALAQYLATARQQDQALTVAVLDIDHFKQVNDRFSHEAGDRALKAVATMLRNTLEPHGAICARYGGEEFVVAFPGMPAATAARVCEQVREQIERNNFGRAREGFKITISAGLSDDQTTDNHERLLALADDKLYEAKRGGRNKVCY